METVSLWTAATTAVWLGILTSISPCPLATNIAAISFIGKQIGNQKHLALNGFFYTLGRVIVYWCLSILVVGSLLSVPQLSFFLQTHFQKWIGPVLIMTGILLLNIIPISFGGGVSNTERLERLTRRFGLFGAFMMGALFALTFCPVSAALFFGSLVPLAFSSQSYILLPLLYGIGTALPVIIFAFTLTVSIQFAARLFRRVTSFERWTRPAMAVILIGIGIYLTVKAFFLTSSPF